jgi:heavy metal sensor kinase
MTLRSRLIITNEIVFAVILIILAVIVYEKTRESEIAKLDSRLESFSVEFATEFEDQWEDKEFPESSEIETIADRGWKDIRIELYDTFDRMLYRRGDLPPISKEWREQALSNRVAFQNISIDGNWFRQLIRPVEADEQIGFVLAVAVPATEVEERLADLTGVLLITVVSALLLSALAVYFFTGRSFQPVNKMIDAAEKISASTLDQRVELPPVHDEVHRLAVALNAMMQRIEDAFKSQRQFVADASHELRTPLTVIYSELEFLKRRIRDQESSESLEASLKEVDRLSRLVQQLLLLARIDSRRLTLDRQVVRLDELLADCVQLQQKNATKKNVKISLHIDDVTEIEGDPELLRRAFINIIDNAVKYSPEGAEIKIDLGRDLDTAVIAVSDRGPGIKNSEIEAVFKRFYRSPHSRHEYDGSGLGLAIVRELVEAHGGTVRIANPHTGGATVEIRFPTRLSEAETK